MFAGLVAFFCLLAVGMSAAESTWPAPGATWRVRAERAPDSPWPAPAGQVLVAPGGLDPQKCKVSVFTTDGSKVNSQVLWATNGDLLSIVFDTSTTFGGSTRLIYVEPGEPTELGWRPHAGLFLETRFSKFARPDSWDEGWKLWNSSGPVLGRSPQPMIFHGIHPHGGGTNFVALFTGWFQAPKAGDYEFAVVATGPAFLRINAKTVAQRGALATAGRGTRGQYGGKIRLTPGRHKLEYLTVHTVGEWIAEVAWKLPSATHFELMPAKAYEPVARYDVAEFENAPNATPRVYFDWHMTDHTLVDEMALVDVRLRAFSDRPAGQWQWTFDDSSKNAGGCITQVFLRTGFRRVDLDLKGLNPGPAGLSQVIKVQPRWTQVSELRETTFSRQKKEILARDLSLATPDDLAALVRVADRLEDRALLAHAGVFCLQRRDAFGPLNADAFYLLGFHYEHPDVREYKNAELAWRAAVQLGLPITREKARLRLAQFLLENAGQPEAALRCLAEMKIAPLDAAEARGKILLRGDAFLLQGKVTEARQAYEKAGALISDINRVQNMRSRARLESAREFVRRGEYDFAEELLRQVEWEEPLEKLSVECGITRIQVYLGRKEFPRALTRGLQMLHVAVADTPRADLLYLTAQAYEGLGRGDDMKAVLKKLVDEFPYSESAAKARDKYGVTPTPAKGKK
jgi:tetratricopeptide (TPR) repeat protein